MAVDDEGSDGDDLADLAMSDCDAAMQLLLRDFAALRLPSSVLPFVLVTQLYSVVDNRTEVDRFIAEGTAKGSLHRFRLPSSRRACALVRHEDYLGVIRAIEARLARDGEEGRSVLAAFRRRVAANAELHGLLHVDEAVLAGALESGRKTLTALSSRVLVRHNLLRPRRLGSYWLALPVPSMLLQWMRDGREDVCKLLRKADVGFDEAATIRLRKSKLPFVFHARDLVGRGRVDEIRTRSGRAFQLALDAPPDSDTEQGTAVGATVDVA